MKNLLFLICLYSTIAIASESKFYPNKLNCCKISKSAMNDYEPEEFQLSNNLLRKTGQQAVYRGTKIIVKGRLLDQDCVPVADAKIYLWQVGSDGKYPYIPLRTRINKKMLNLVSKSSFTGSGIATTNNKGEFYFITIYPSGILRETPNVNIRVDHLVLGQLQTKLYLSDSRANLENCGEVSHVLFTALDGIKTYEFDVVMPGRTLKRY
ncbi:dioxygenase [Candidatus Tisiphia endosymbiont of Temnostethus pusillus]|uniref:dioxygenase family protein n=1 Tax=Candidatus Tisiphia endosymbiont of Temnostethus pusillus TaxID=3139335 RepID=UPI0035C8D763